MHSTLLAVMNLVFLALRFLKLARAQNLVATCESPQVWVQSRASICVQSTWQQQPLKQCARAACAWWKGCFRQENAVSHCFNLKLVSWVRRRSSRPQSPDHYLNGVPLGYEANRRRTAGKSSDATAWCYHVHLDRNLWVIKIQEGVWR